MIKYRMFDEFTPLLEAKQLSILRQFLVASASWEI